MIPLAASIKHKIIITLSLCFLIHYCCQCNCIIIILVLFSFSPCSLILPPPPILVISVCPPDLLWTQDHLKQAKSLENENCLPSSDHNLGWNNFQFKKKWCRFYFYFYFTIIFLPQATMILSKTKLIDFLPEAMF